jgi:phospholipid transport system transporter-binding protein
MSNDSSVVGALDFATVGALLDSGAEALRQSTAETVIDLKSVSHSDSAGLALLIEWMSLARAAGKTLRYTNMPSQVQQLARLSEVEDLLTP